MSTPTAWQGAAERLTAALHLKVAPIAIGFSTTAESSAPAFADPPRPMPEPTPDGRTGRVPAGCVFWVHALDHMFSTRPEDHGNCSVGSLTHGLTDLGTAALVESGWVTPEIFPAIPAVASRPRSITYGPLAEAKARPDVVPVRTNAWGVMTLGDALGDLVIEGKPQCHIIAIAKEQNRPAASVGCALSRARTGMPAHEMACALPGSRLETMLDAIEEARAVDATVARYAAEDANRFGRLR